jgi:hypothetical protein
VGDERLFAAIIGLIILIVTGIGHYKGRFFLDPNEGVWPRERMVDASLHPNKFSIYIWLGYIVAGVFLLYAIFAT